MTELLDDAATDPWQIIADLQGKLAEAHAERDEALNQQIATTEVLQVINSLPGDLGPVFDAMLEKAMRLCDAAFGFLNTYDGERLTPAAQKGVPPALADYFASGMDQPRPGDAYSRLLAGEDLIHSLDVMDEEPYRLGTPLRRAVVDLGGARTALNVALRKDGALLGVFTVYRKEVRPFSEKQVALIRNFAAQAVIAMENARLITETREALEQQTATSEVLGVINSSPGDLAPVFDAMIEKAVRLCSASHGMLRTFDGEMFHLAAVHDDPRLKQLGPGEALETLPTDDLLGRIVSGESLVHIADVRETDTYRDFPDIRERLERGGIRTWLAVALRKDGTLLGVITVYRRLVRPF
jgi:GAF domain-containing protein